MQYIQVISVFFFIPEVSDSKKNITKWKGGKIMLKNRRLKRGRDEKMRTAKERGITLIALIVTIIVLLILADSHIFLNIPQ